MLRYVKKAELISSHDHVKLKLNNRAINLDKHTNTSRTEVL